MRRTLLRVVIVFCLLPLASPAGAAKPQPANDVVRFQVEIPEDALRLQRSAIPGSEGKLTTVALDLDEPTFLPAEPGAALLPAVQRLVALPAGATIVKTTVTPLATVEIPDVQLIPWVQPANPGQQQKLRDPIPPEFPTIGNDLLFFPSGTTLAPAAGFMSASQWPAQIATALPLSLSQTIPIARIDVTPLVWNPSSATLRFHTKIDVEVRFIIGKPNPKGPKPVQADIQILEGLRPLVVNPELIPNFPPVKPRVNDAQYLIITDNWSWNPDGTRGAALEGDLVEGFQRLADWKTTKGVRARVVTVSEIVEGRYGDFRSGAADLPEVIRNFLKFARSHLQTTWVLLGGDETIIPPRYVLSNAWVNAAHNLIGVADEKPPEGRMHWHAATETVRIHAPVIRYLPDVKILSARDSTVFEFVGAPRVGNPGWGYVTDDTYQFPSFLPTDYVVLRGPRALVEGTHYYLALDENMIPTDLYYASVAGPEYGKPGVRDWDANGDGYYGQHTHVSLDGVSFAPDLFVGRAPVRTGLQARDFSSGVRSYENGLFITHDFAKRALLAATNWGSAGPRVNSLASSFTPRPGGFQMDEIPGGTEARLYFHGAPPTPAWSLVFWRGSSGYEIIPYSLSATPASPGFAFYTDVTFSTISETVLELPFGFSLHFPLASQFVKVSMNRPSIEIRPHSFFFDNLEPDGALIEKEMVKEILARSAPEITEVKSFYEDWFDFPGGPRPDLRLTPTLVADTVRDGQNIISLSGHGSSGGCCGLSTPYLRTGPLSGLVYADSCLTNAFDDGVAFSEEMAGGGAGNAVAYIGNTRFSWIGSGAEIERSFWNRFRFTGNLGQLHNDKATLATNSTKIWSHYSLNLLGDPEMSVWRGAPRRMLVTVEPSEIHTGDRVRVRVRASGGEPLFAIRVAATGPRFFDVGYTDADGWVELGPVTLVNDTLTILPVANGYQLRSEVFYVTPGGS